MVKHVGFKTWLLAARPKTLWAGVAPVVMGTAMALGDGGFHAGAALCALLASLLIQIATNYANDYYDFKKGADTEQRTGPTRATQAGLVKPAQMRRAYLVTFGLAALSSAFLIYRGGVPILVITIVSVLSGYLYTGGPKPLGYLGLGDLFVLIFFGPVAVAGTYYVQTLTVNAAVILAGFAPGLLSVAILVVNNLRDSEQDRYANKKTLVVRFGDAFARSEYAACIIGALLIPLAIVLGSHEHAWILLTFLILPFAMGPLKCVFWEREKRRLNPVLGQTARLLLMYSVLFSVGWVL